MSKNNPGVVPAQGNLLPELFPFLKGIAAQQPESFAAIIHMLDTFCQPWADHHMSGMYVHHSLLTPSGYPIRFTFHSDAADICYTVEPGLPQAGIFEKQQFIKTITGHFNFNRNILQQLSAQPEQCFGNWLGIQHHAGEAMFKVYQEITRQGFNLFREKMTAAIPALSGTTQILQPILACFIADQDEIGEFYCHVEQPDIHRLHVLFDVAGVAGRLPYVLNILSYLAGEEKTALLKWLRIGISYRITEGNIPELTLFVHVPQIFTSNITARKRILGLVRQINGEMPLYEQLTAQLLIKDPGYPIHSIISLKPSASGKFTCSVSLSPWHLYA